MYVLWGTMGGSLGPFWDGPWGSVEGSLVRFGDLPQDIEVCDPVGGVVSDAWGREILRVWASDHLKGESLEWGRSDLFNEIDKWL